MLDLPPSIACLMTTPISSTSLRPTAPHLALVRAYAAPSGSSARTGTGVGASTGTGAAPAGVPAPRAAAPARRVDTLVGEASGEIAARIAPASSAKTDALVAAKVPGRIDFGASAAAAANRAQGQPLPFYRAPSDRNEAATAILIGRGLDITG